MNANILDCTLRDGGYYNNWDFNINFVNKYLKAISKTPIKYVEIGFRGIDHGKKNKGKFWYTTNSTLSSLKKPKNINLGVMINASDYVLNKGSIDLKNLRKNFNQKKSISFVRIAFHLKEYKEAIKIGRYIKSRGYITGLNLMQISRTNISDLKKVAKNIQNLKPDIFYIADSLGDLNPQKLQKISKVLRSYWHGEVGLHAHDNLKLALQNTLFAKKLKFEWLDGTVLGMGRGPGNVKTEELLVALKLIDKKNYLFHFIREEFQKYLHKFQWGTNIYYAFSAKNNIHPTFVQEMLSDERYQSEDIMRVLKKIKNSFFYNPNILDNFKKTIEIKFNKNNLKKIKLSSNILILANTENLKKNINKINDFIKITKPSVISLNPNFAINLKKLDYVIACNDIRILADLKKYSVSKFKTILPFQNIEKSILKHIKNKNFVNIETNFFDDKEYSFNNHSIFLPKKLSLPYALAICDIKKCKNIFLAGFEGYKSNPSKREEIQNLINIFIKKKKYIRSISSLTKTLYKLKK